MKNVELLKPCNLDTVRDGRGGIFTFYPEDPIVEINFNIVKAGNIRGNHYHHEFDEYYVLTNGEGSIYTDKSNNDREEFLYLSRGSCTRTNKGVSHVFSNI